MAGDMRAQERKRAASMAARSFKCNQEAITFINAINYIRIRGRMVLTLAVELDRSMASRAELTCSLKLA